MIRSKSKGLKACKRSAKGFTLAELLIALAILGVIATFTIPKVLNSGQSGQNTAVFKESASTISGAFSAYQLENTVASGVGPADFTKFINYVSTLSTATTGNDTTQIDCNNGGVVCLQLHNGGILAYDQDQVLPATPNNDTYLTFWVDPDGADGTEDPTSVNLHFNGRLTDGANAAGTAATGGLAGDEVDTDYANW